MINEYKNKLDAFMKRLLIYILFFFTYIYVPSIFASFFYLKLGLSEITSSLIGDSIYLVILIFIFRKMLKEKIKDYKDNFSKYFGYALKYWGIGLIVLFISNLILNTLVFNGEIAQNEALNRSLISSNVFSGAILVVFVAPFIEEMIFRYGLRNVVGKNKYFPLISAIVFGLPHALTGITSYLELLYVIPYGALGYAFAYIYNKTDNILVNMSMHMLHNFMCIVIILIGV